MTIRTLDRNSSAATAKIPSLLVSADSHVFEDAKIWKPLPSETSARIPQRKVPEHLEGGRNPKLRMGAMDRDGVKAEILYPSDALAIFAMKPEEQKAAFPLYNDWLAEYCETSPDRLFGIPCLQTYDIDAAVKELHRCYDMGLLGALIWQVPDPKLPFSSDHYEKLWSAAAELGAPINLHILTGHSYRYQGKKLTGIEQTRGSVNHKTADAVNTLFDFVWTGVLDRHPKLKIEMVEAEIGWIPFILQQWDYYFSRFSKPGAQQEKFPINRPPSEICKEHVYYTFMDDFIGSKTIPYWGEDNCMWSSDYPHGNTTWPESRAFVARQIGDLPMATQKKLLSENVKKLYALDV